MSSNEELYTITARLRPATKQKLEQWCSTAGCTSKNEFIERAINFYGDCLAINSNDLLPKAIVTAIDGRLSMLEKRISSIAFRHDLAQDMTNGILADAFNFTRDDLQRRRAESVKNVKRTNGFISLEKRVRDTADTDYDEDDEAWQG